MAAPAAVSLPDPEVDERSADAPGTCAPEVDDVVQVVRLDPSLTVVVVTVVVPSMDAVDVVRTVVDDAVVVEVVGSGSAAGGTATAVETGPDTAVAVASALSVDVEVGCAEVAEADDDWVVDEVVIVVVDDDDCVVVDTVELLVPESPGGGAWGAGVAAVATGSSACAATSVPTVRQA